MNLVETANKYYDSQEPWKQIKENEQEFVNTIFTCSNIIANLSNLFEPIMPETTQKIRNYLDLEKPIWKPIYLDKEINVSDKNIEALFERIKYFQRLKKVVYSSAGCSVAKKTFRNCNGNFGRWTSRYKPGQSLFYF